MSSILGNVAGAVVGGLMGGDDEQSQTASKDPWAPAVKPLTNSLNTGQDLERYYQQQPFNPLQQTAYQNLFSDLDSYRGQNNGMMNFANRLMNTNYQRGGQQTQMQPQMMTQGGDGVYSTKPAMMPGGLLAGMGQAAQGQINPDMSAANYAGQGLLGQPQQGVFSGNPGQSYGLLNFAELNPFTASNGIPKTPVAEAPVQKTPEDLAREEWERLMRTGEAYRGSGA